MKKVSMVAFAATALMAISCSDDDNSSNSTTVSGKWNLTKITTDQAFDGNEDGVATKDLIAETGNCWTGTYIEFLGSDVAKNFVSAPSMGNQCFTQEVEGTYEVEGNNVIVTATDEDGTSEMEYAKNGSKLTSYIPDFYEIEVTVGGETQFVSVAATVEFTKE